MAFIDPDEVTSGPAKAGSFIDPDEAAPVAKYVAPTIPLPEPNGKTPKAPDTRSYLSRGLDELGGINDAAQNLIAGGVGTLVGAPIGFGEAIVNGTDLDKTMGKRVEAITKGINKYTSGGYKPESADKYNDLVNSAIADIGIPLIGMPHIAMPKEMRSEAPRKLSPIEQKIADLKKTNAFVDPDFIKTEDKKGAAASAAITPETKAAQETLNAQDAGGAFKPEKVAQDLSQQRELPFTNENLPNKAELQGDLFGDMKPLENVDRPPIEPDFSRAQSDANRIGDLFNEQEAKTSELDVKKAQIEQMYQERSASAAADGNRKAYEKAKEVRDIQLQLLEQGLREDAYAPGQGRKLTIPKSQRGSAPIINDVAEGLIKKFSKVDKTGAKYDISVEPMSLGADRGTKSIMVSARDPVTGERRGVVDFAIRPDGTLTAENAKVAPSYKGRGIAELMYTAAREAGHDIAPGRVQTDAGHAMVERLQAKGLINKPAEGSRFRAGDLDLVPINGERMPGDRYIPKGQRGSAPIINDIASFFTQNKAPKDILEGALTEGKDGKGINNLEAGATLAAAKRNSGLIRDGSRILQTAEKKAELANRQFVFPAEQALKGLKRSEIVELGHVMKAEMFDRTPITSEQILQLGLSEKQLKAYGAMKEMFNKAYEAQNEMRKAQGLKEITKSESYLSSRWAGDFRRPVLDAEGKLKWYLAADSKMGLERQWKALKEEYPSLIPGKDHVVRATKGSNDIQATLASVIDVLGRDDPAVKKIQEWAEEQTIKEGRGAAGQEKHFENKANIRGFVGDRPGKAPLGENVAMFQQQMTYAKNAFKWAELQKAGESLKEVLNDPALAEQQPNNVAYMKDYYRNQLGMGEAKWVAAMEDAIRSTGVSPHLIGAGVGGVKTLFILQKMAASLGFTVSNVIQFVNNMPHIMEITKNPLNIALAVPMGLASGSLMATGHYLNAVQKSKALYEIMKDIPNGKFLTEAMRYAEDNGITSRSVLDESPIGNSFSALGKVENLAGKTLSIPETFLRSASYMTYVQLLEDSGKFPKTAEGKLQLFREAEEKVNIAMGDYRQSEKAMMFSKLGTMGNALNTLQTYPINFYQQWNYATRQAAKGSVAPLLALVATQYTVAGAMGLPGFNDASKAWDWIKEHLPTSMWAKVKDVDPKEAVLKAGGASALYGALSTQTGVGFTSRVTAPGAGEMITSPGGPAADLLKQAKSLAALATDPMNKDKQTQAAMDVAPTGLQGYLETGPLRDRMSVESNGKRVYRKTTDVADRKGMYARTPAEETIRSFGMRSQNEVMEKELAYTTSKKASDANKRSMDIVNEVYSAARNGDVERTKDLMKLYTQITGKGVTDAQFTKQVMDEYTTAAQRAATGAKQIEALKAVKQMQEFLQNAN